MHLLLYYNDLSIYERRLYVFLSFSNKTKVLRLQDVQEHSAVKLLVWTNRRPAAGESAAYPA